jgi:hypothetical protein
MLTDKDKHTPFSQLAPLEKLNCLADFDAKTRLIRTLAQLETPDNPPAAVPDIIFGEGIRIVCRFTQSNWQPQEHNLRAYVPRSYR